MDKEDLKRFAAALRDKLIGAPMVVIPGTEYNNGDTESGFYGDEEIDPAWLDAQIDKLCDEFEDRNKENRNG